MAGGAAEGYGLRVGDAGGGGLELRRVEPFVNFVPQDIESETADSIYYWPLPSHQNDPKELEIPVVTRVVYDPASSAILYGFYRVLRFNPDGLLVSAGVETRYEIDKPVQISI